MSMCSPSHRAFARLRRREQASEDTSSWEGSMVMNITQLRAYIELGAAMVIVGSIVVVSKAITATFPVFLASALRFVVALAILLPLWLKEGRGISLPGRRDAWIMFLQSFAGNFLYGILLLYGLKWTSAVEGGI